MKYVIAVLCALYVATASADKCTDVYNSCVNSTGSDAMSRFKCGMKYLRCRFNDMRNDEDLLDEIFDEEGKDCGEEYKQCKDDAKSIKDKIACRKEAMKCKYEELVKPKVQCLKKCQDIDSLKARMVCRKECFKSSETESEVLFDGEEKDCGEEYKQCKDDAKSIKEKIACRKEAMKCKYEELVKPKVECLKKCQDIDSFKARMVCRKECFKSSEAESEVLFDGEEKDCKDVFQQCRADAKSVEDKVACYKQAAKCKYEKHIKPKFECMKKCKDADSFKARMECRMKCFKGSEEEMDFADMLFDGEEKTCYEQLKQCLGDAQNNAERGACLDASKQCAKDKLQPKVDCVNKCREGYRACAAAGSSRWTCGKQFYQCVKPCKDA